jgi:hypothetical protein
MTEIEKEILPEENLYVLNEPNYIEVVSSEL